MQLVLDIYHPSWPAVMLKAKRHLVITPPVSRCRDGTAQCWWSSYCDGTPDAAPCPHTGQPNHPSLTLPSNFQIIDVQKRMIQQQGFMIVDLNHKIHQVEAKDAPVQESNKISDGDLISFGEVGSGGKAFNTVNNINNNNSKKYSELYQKAAVEVSKKGLDEEYEDVEDDDDNDSFITIDSDADSEATLEEGGAGRESESSDSGYTDYADLSYGVNPLFSSLGAQDTASQRCQDFVFFKQSQDSGMQTYTAFILCIYIT